MHFKVVTDIEKHSDVLYDGWMTYACSASEMSSPGLFQLYSSHIPLRIGYYEEDGFFLPSPGMRRVLLETKQLLGEAGHQVRGNLYCLLG